MIFTETSLRGVFLVDLEPHGDERGFFARAYCTQEFKVQGLHAGLEQCSVSFNDHKGTLRGLHHQGAPHEEHKLVRCTGGAVFDVIVDIRPQSSSYLRWFGTELSAQNHRALFIPPGYAHGFITLSEAAEVYYMISVPYAPQYALGFRWNDPAFGIQWPLTPSVISARDAAYALVKTGER